MPHSRKPGEITPEIEIEIENPPEISPSQKLDLFLEVKPEPIPSHYVLPQKIGQTFIRFTNAMANMTWYPSISLSSPAKEMVTALAICINAIVDDVSTAFSLRPLSHFNPNENPGIKKKLTQATCIKVSALALTSLLALLLDVSKKNFDGSLDKNNYELGAFLNNPTFGEPLFMLIEYSGFRLTETIGLKLWEYLSPSPEEIFIDRPDLNSAQDGVLYIKRVGTDLGVLNYTNSFSLSVSAWTKYAILVDASLKLANYFSFKINPLQNLNIANGCIAQCGPQNPPLGEEERSPREISYQGGMIRVLGYGIGALAAYVFANCLDYTFPNQFEAHPYTFKFGFTSIVIGTDYLARNSKRLFADVKTLGKKTGITNAFSSLANCSASFFKRQSSTFDKEKLLVDPTKEDTFRITV